MLDHSLQSLYKVARSVNAMQAGLCIVEYSCGFRLILSHYRHESSEMATHIWLLCFCATVAFSTLNISNLWGLFPHRFNALVSTLQQQA